MEWCSFAALRLTPSAGLTAFPGAVFGAVSVYGNSGDRRGSCYCARCAVRRKRNAIPDRGASRMGWLWLRSLVYMAAVGGTWLVLLPAGLLGCDPPRRGVGLGPC